MLSDPTFLPILNRNDWRGLTSSFVHKLFRDDPSPPGGLVVSYGMVGEAANVYLTKGALREMGVSAPELRRTALEHLAQRPEQPRWEANTAGGHKYLLRAGDESTSAEILVPRILAKANEHFREKQVFVAVPNRFSIIASPEPLLLVRLAGSMYREAVNENGAALTHLVFIVEAGRLVGFAMQAGEAPQTLKGPVDTAKLSRALLLGPLNVLYCVLMADGHFTQPRFDVFLEVLGRRSQGACKIVRELIGATLDNVEEASRKLQSIADPMGLLQELSNDLAENMPPKARAEYADLLLEMARAVSKTPPEGAPARGARSAYKPNDRHRELLTMLDFLLRQAPGAEPDAGS